MAASSAFTEENLLKLEEALAEGALEVKYQDRSIRYRSVNEMLKIRNLMRKALGKSQKTGRVFAQFDKGTC